MNRHIPNAWHDMYIIPGKKNVLCGRRTTIFGVPIVTHGGPLTVEDSIGDIHFAWCPVCLKKFYNELCLYNGPAIFKPIIRNIMLEIVDLVEFLGKVNANPTAYRASLK